MTLARQIPEWEFLQKRGVAYARFTPRQRPAWHLSSKCHAVTGLAGRSWGVNKHFPHAV